MTRGFITIATGADRYYQLAKNLLLSYKLYSDSPCPFAILCDRENEYTALFDRVVLFQPGQHPYFDKFELLKRSPFEETIFVDADCLAYADLNGYWAYFAGADDFSKVPNGGAGIQIFPADYGVGMLTLPVGGFLVLACLIAAMQWALGRPKKDKEESK